MPTTRRHLAVATLPLVLVAACGGGGAAGAPFTLSTDQVTITEVQGPDWPAGANVSVTVTAPEAASAGVGPPSGETWPSWLYATVSGTGRTGTIFIGLGAIRTMPIGTHHATVRFTVRRADDSVLAFQDIQVTYLVVAGLGAWPGDFEFTHVLGSPWPYAVPPVASTLVQGTSGLPFTASADQAWLTLDVTSGVVPQTLHLGFDPTGLAPGVYPGHVTVLGGPSPSVVAVSLTVTAPVLTAAVSGGGLVLTALAGHPSNEQAVFLSLGTGTNVHPWTITSRPAWLYTPDTSGSVSMLNRRIGFTSDPTLPAGVHTGTVSFAADVLGTPVTASVPVTCTVLAP